MLAILLIAAGIVLGAIVAFTLYKRSHAKPRSLSIRELSERLGFEFSEKDNTILEKIKFFKIYNVATLQASAHNVLHSKTKPPEAWIFDYESVIGTPDSSVTTVQTTFYFTDERMKTPGFRLFPVHAEINKREDTVFKYRPISFSSQPAFAAKYRLIGPDEHEIRELFSPEMIEYFGKLKNICVEGFDRELLIYQPRKIVAEKEFQDYYQIAQTIFQFILDRSAVADSAKGGSKPSK
jgi:hypothetical protein